MPRPSRKTPALKRKFKGETFSGALKRSFPRMNPRAPTNAWMRGSTRDLSPVNSKEGAPTKVPMILVSRAARSLKCRDSPAQKRVPPSQAVWRGPSALTGELDFRPAKERSLLKSALAAGSAIPCRGMRAPRPPKNRYFAVNISGVIMPRNELCRLTRKHAEPDRVSRAVSVKVNLDALESSVGLARR